MPGRNCLKNPYDSGTYILLIRLKNDVCITVKSEKHFTLEKGWYCYTGKAKNNLIKRVSRHIRHSDNLHWHIDYLLESGEVLEVYFVPDYEHECELAKEVASFSDKVIDDFGASDCNCKSHLCYFKNRPKIIELLKNKENIKTIYVES